MSKIEEKIIKVIRDKYGDFLSIDDYFFSRKEVIAIQKKYDSLVFMTFEYDIEAIKSQSLFENIKRYIFMKSSVSIISREKLKKMFLGNPKTTMRGNVIEYFFHIDEDFGFSILSPKDKDCDSRLRDFCLKNKEKKIIKNTFFSPAASRPDFSKNKSKK